MHLNSPLLWFLNIRMNLKGPLYCVVYCSMRNPLWGYFGCTYRMVYVELFKLNLTVLPYHTGRDVENFQQMSSWFQKWYSDITPIVLTFVDTYCVRNGSNPLERVRVRVGTGTEPLQRFSPHDNPDRCNWAGFTPKNATFQPHKFASNEVFEFWLYCDMISTQIVQFYEFFYLPLSYMWSDKQSWRQDRKPNNFA